MRKITLSSLLGMLLIAGVMAAPNAALATTPNATFVMQPLAPPEANAPAGLTAISCQSSSACVGVGVTEHAGSITGLAATLQGDTWTLSEINQDHINGPELDGVWCSSITSCIAVGSHDDFLGNPAPLIETLSGTTWTATTSGLEPTGATKASLSSISCVSPTSCVATGTYTKVGGNHVLVETLAGTNWSPSTAADPGGSTDAELSGITCFSATSCLGVGSWGTASPPNMPLLERLTGTTWTASTLGSAGDALTSISCSSATSCVAVGNATGGHTVAEVLTGASWSRQVVPLPGSTSSISLSGVSCTPDGSACVAVGSYHGVAPDNTVPHGLVELFAGGFWNPTTGIDPSGGSVAATSVSCPVDVLSCTGAGIMSVAGPSQEAVAIYAFPPTCNGGPACNAPPTGYDLVASDGGIFNYGNAGFFGSAGSLHLNAPIVGMAASPGGDGYWLVASDGGIFNYGGAGFHGSAGGHPLNPPIVGMAATPDGGGYWLVASDGGIFSYGDAGFFGSTGGFALNTPIVGMAATPDGSGYWLVASDGGIFNFGDATFHGSAGSLHLNMPVVGMAATPGGGGYWLAASDGGIFTYGDATFHGSAGSLHLNKPVVGMASSGTGGGYWLVASDGGIFDYGDAGFFGSTGSLHLNAPVVGIG